jgi:cobyrinic acid a,c-diamide synthase
MTKSILVSGTHSGCGKTSLTLGLLAALTRRGMRCAPFKTGPDFIDPGLHELACGRVSHNLDSWMLSPGTNSEIFSRYASGSDVAVIEGAMGLFDGASGVSESGSAAHMAKLLGIPVVLVVDVSGMARSVAAMARGFSCFDPDLATAGVVCNRVGGPGHREFLAEALDMAGVPVLGSLARVPELAMPSRHLGLVTAQDLTAHPDWIQRLADWVEAGVDVDRLLRALPETGLAPTCPPVSAPSAPPVPPPPRRVRLGVARDRAFCFAYAENLRLLDAAGADVFFFSPLADQRLPDGLDGLYLPGGYPELHAEALSANTAMLSDIRGFCLSGRPVYAECGGFMALTRAIEDQEGRAWPMAGVFDCTARMRPRFAALGYREALLTTPTPLGPAGTVARGHEFHYSNLTGVPDVPAVYRLSGRKGPLDAPEGFLRGNTLGSYVHLHFASNPDLAGNFVAAMARGGLGGS